MSEPGTEQAAAPTDEHASSDVPAAAVATRCPLPVETIVFWSLLAAMAVLYLVPLWAVAYPPMLDLPVHLELASIYRSHGDASSTIGRFYEGRGAGVVPYLTLYGLMDGLSLVLPLKAAMKVVLSIVALGLIGALLSLLHGFGRSRWLAFLGLPLIYDVNCTYGYISFRLSVGLCLGTVGLLRRNLDGPRLWRDLLLGVLAALTFLTHAHGFAVLVLLWALVTVLCAPRARAMVRAALPLLPALALSAHWYLSALLAKGPTPGKVSTPFAPLIRLMELVPHRILNSFADGRDELVALCLALLCGALLVSSPRPALPDGARGLRGLRRLLGAYALELCAGLMIVAYFAVPNQLLTPTQQIYGINYRFLLVICLLVVALPRLELRRWRAFAVAPAVLLAAYFGLVVVAEYRSFDQRCRPFDRVLAAIPRGKRVLAFNYETWDPKYTLPTLGHFVGYYAALKDGVTSFDHSGTQYNYIPVRMRDERALPSPNYPGPLNMAVFGPRYDYFLVADRPGSRRAPFDVRQMRLVVEAGMWRVYEQARR